MAMMDSYVPLQNTAVPYLLLMVVFCVVAACVGYVFKEKFKEKNNKTILLFVILTVVVGGALLYFFGAAVGAFKGFLFFLILLVSAYSDYKTREIENSLSVMIVLTAMIGIKIESLPAMCVSALTVGLPMFVGSVLVKDRAIGGADIKLSLASAFLLGIRKGFFGLILGLVLGIVANVVLNRKNSKSGFPLVPYLSVGFVTAYFI